MPEAPRPRTDRTYAVELVCLGNICRSPMAHVALEAAIAEARLGDRVDITSSGTGDWHVGNPMDRRAARTLTDAGYDATRHLARQLPAGRVDEADLVLVMDKQNLQDVGGANERVRLFRDFDPVEPGGVVPDPYYGGAAGFEEVLAMVRRTSAALTEAIAATLEPAAR